MSKNVVGVPIPQQPPAAVLDDSVTVPQLFSLKGKVASVTGGSAGIGWAVVEGYAQAGADLAVWYNSTDPREAAAALATKYGVTVRTYKAKIDDADAVEATIAQQLKDFGHIDVFVANAGVAWTSGALIDSQGTEAWDRIVNVDLNAVFFCARAVGRHFRERGSGSFIITASISGHIVNVPQKQACYNAVKAATIQLGKSLAIEWAGFARVNTISPGYVSTNMIEFASDATSKLWNEYTPLGRPGLPKELAGAFLYFASDASSWTTGADLIIDGGYTCW